MMLDRIKSQRDACLDAIDNSNFIDDGDKMMFRDLINNAANGTNGLIHDEKLQNVSETVFSLVMLKILDKCNGYIGSSNKASTIYQTIVECKWPLVVLGAIVGTVLIIAPEILPIITKCFGS